MTKEERTATLAKIKELSDASVVKAAAIKAAKAELNALRKQQRELKQSLRGK